MRMTGAAPFVGSSSLATTWIGNCPRNMTATLTTLPPISLQIGGVSVHPPARSMRTGIDVHTA